MGLLSSILRNGTDGRLTWWCPGCDSAHQVATGSGPGPRWGWNGNAEKPTFTPSVLVTWSEPSDDPEKAGDEAFDIKKVCHSFVVDGRMQFLSDCTHVMAGQTVDIPVWPKPNWSDG